MRAIRKHLADVLALLGLLVVAVVVSVIILGHQRVTLPGWVPFVGQRFFDVSAEMTTAQAVTPGQGQTVNIAGVEVGEISSVRLQDGRAVIGMKIKPEYDLIYRNATVLLRPKTGLKDMVAELDPGTPAAGRLPAGGTIPVSQTLPDVNLDEILASLDADTRDFLTLLLNGGAQGLGGERGGRRLGQALRRIEPTALYAKRINRALAQRRRNLARVIHNLSLLTSELGRRDTQLAGFVQNNNAVFGALAAEDRSLRATLRELPSSLVVTRSTLAKVRALADELGPTLQALRPGARALGPSLAQTRPFLRQTTPVIRDELRPFTRAALPTVEQLRPAASDLAAAAPDLNRLFAVVDYAFNELTYNPPGAANEGFEFWLAWASHIGNTVFANQDAQGPIRRGLVMLSCQTTQLLRSVAQSNPQLGTLVGLLNAPSQEQICPRAGGG
jgi:phospholipid/cholesterol/gamma-HCH transport system substrate-binding protein